MQFPRIHSLGAASTFFFASCASAAGIAVSRTCFISLMTGYLPTSVFAEIAIRTTGSRFLSLGVGRWTLQVLEFPREVDGGKHDCQFDGEPLARANCRASLC